MTFCLIPIVSRSKSNWYKHQKIKTFALNLQLQTIQIFTNDVDMLIMSLSYFITTVNIFSCWGGFSISNLRNLVMKDPDTNTRTYNMFLVYQI